MVGSVLQAAEDFLFSWTGFAIVMAVVVLSAVLVWRRWRRWNPVIGTSAEARQAEARLWQTRSMDQR